MKIFCQYSYGGFRTYRILGTNNDVLEDNEVTCENNADFPNLADLYFNRSGYKLIFRHLNNNKLALIVRDIPGPEEDSDGRPINVAVQFIAEKNERTLLDRLCLAISKDIDAFGAMFTSGFSLKDGIHYNGLPLMNFITNSTENPVKKIPEILSDLSNRQGTVLLFVPSSHYFGQDKNHTLKVITQLQLASSRQDVDQLLKRSINIDDLRNLDWKETNNIPDLPQANEKEADSVNSTLIQTQPSASPSNSNQYDSLTRKYAQLEIENNQIKQQLDVALNDKNSQKHLIYILTAVSVIAVITCIFCLFNK